LKPVVIVPGGAEAFVFHVNLFGLVVFQQAEGRSSRQAEVGVGMPLAHSARIFLKRDVELPVQRIFNAPVPTGALMGNESVRRAIRDQRRALLLIHIENDHSGATSVAPLIVEANQLLQRVDLPSLSDDLILIPLML
jgi:hypothetical protein